MYHFFRFQNWQTIAKFAKGDELVPGARTLRAAAGGPRGPALRGAAPGREPGRPTHLHQLVVRCKGAHWVDLGESFQMSSHYLLAKIVFDTAENVTTY